MGEPVGTRPLTRAGAAAGVLGRDDDRESVAAAGVLGRDDDRESVAAAGVLGRDDDRESVVAIGGRRPPKAAGWHAASNDE